MPRCAVVMGGVMLHYEVTAGGAYAEGDMILLYELAVGDVSGGNAYAEGGIMVRCEMIVRCVIVDYEVTLGGYAVGVVSVGGGYAVGVVSVGGGYAVGGAFAVGDVTFAVGGVIVRGA